jgi:hypothetical protein
MEVSGQLHTPAALPPGGKIPWYLLDRRLVGPQSRSGRGGVQKNSQPLPGLEPVIIQPVAQRYTTELSRLLILLKETNVTEASVILFAPCLSNMVPCDNITIINGSSRWRRISGLHVKV